MKKVINVKEIMMIIMSVILIVISTEVFATNPVLGSDNNNVPAQVSKDEYEGAQEPTVSNNNVAKNNAVANNSLKNNTNKKVYNTNNTNLPQTGIEDYNVGILLIICVASAIFAYKKVNDYKNI